MVQDEDYFPEYDVGSIRINSPGGSMASLSERSRSQAKMEKIERVS